MEVCSIPPVGFKTPLTLTAGPDSAATASAIDKPLTNITSSVHVHSPQRTGDQPAITYLHLLTLALSLHVFYLLLHSFSAGIRQSVSQPTPAISPIFSRSGGVGRGTHISFSMNSNLPSTVLTASLRSCFSRTGPTSL